MRHAQPALAIMTPTRLSALHSCLVAAVCVCQVHPCLASPCRQIQRRPPQRCRSQPSRQSEPTQTCPCRRHPQVSRPPACLARLRWLAQPGRARRCARARSLPSCPALPCRVVRAHAHAHVLARRLGGSCGLLSSLLLSSPLSFHLHPQRGAVAPARQPRRAHACMHGAHAGITSHHIAPCLRSLSEMCLASQDVPRLLTNAAPSCRPTPLHSCRPPPAPPPHCRMQEGAELPVQRSAQPQGRQPLREQLPVRAAALLLRVPLLQRCAARGAFHA